MPRCTRWPRSGALAIVPAVLVVLVMTGKVRLGGTGTPSAQSTTEATSQAGTSSMAAPVKAPGDVLDEQYALLGELQRPRPVRMSRQGKMNTAIISISLLVLAGVLIAMVVMQPAALGAAGCWKCHGAADRRVPAAVWLDCGDCIRDAAVAFAAAATARARRDGRGAGDQAMDRAKRQRDSLRIRDALGREFFPHDHRHRAPVSRGNERCPFFTIRDNRKNKSRSARHFMKSCCPGNDKDLMRIKI